MPNSGYQKWHSLYPVSPFPRSSGTKVQYSRENLDFIPSPFDLPTMSPAKSAVVATAATRRRGLRGCRSSLLGKPRTPRARTISIGLATRQIT